jgi:phosphoenolpyruvate---glycerone phosphotransferase subunit DhaL
MKQLTIDQLRAVLVTTCEGVVAARDRLTKADQAIGDGDHGVGMARGFAAARDSVAAAEASTVGDLYKAVGSAVLATIGGAAGPIFGTMFRAPAKVLTGTTLDADEFASALEEAARQIQSRGKAQPGQKTMLDALVPASEAARSAVGDGLEASARAAADAAREGMEHTKDMVATLGKSRTLGERSLGHPDPGAVSVVVILESMTEAIEAA